jgi:hypothetical protein
VESDTVLVFMHPVGGGAYPMVAPRAPGFIHAVQPHRFNHSTVADMAGQLTVRARRCTSTNSNAFYVSPTWSGGGALSLYYQEQAERPFVTATPAGDSPDLTAAGLVPADAVMLLAAHTSRHGVLTLSLTRRSSTSAIPIGMIPSSISTGRALTPPYDRGSRARDDRSSGTVDHPW